MTTPPKLEPMSDTEFHQKLDKVLDSFWKNAKHCYDVPFLEFTEVSAELKRRLASKEF